MLKLRLLGQFDVRLEGKRVTIPSRAGQSLLAYLALTADTSHRREKLAGTFWPETTDDIARKNLRQELWRVRKSIQTGQSTHGDFIVSDDFSLKFNRASEYWLDVAQIENPDLDLQSLISNLSHYQGELLPGFYDDWISIERERIQAIFESRMEKLLEQLTTAERWIAVQEWGERWLSLSGVREPAYRALMLASGARGDMAKVASLYQRCTDDLMEYLGVEPSAETRTLYEGLLTGAKKSRTIIRPTGTITFLFSDIEGSTHLLEKLGDQYALALSDHHEIIRTAIQKWNGQEMETQGDSFFVTFSSAIDAVQCAAEAQRALTAHSWPQGESLRVRMGLHTGEPLIASTGYVGMDVHRAARIGDAGHGGQILLSQTTHDLVSQDLPDGVEIQGLGEYRLKDMKFPTNIYQLVVSGLPREYPPLRIKFTGFESPTPGEAPFKGLQFFEENDSDLFFGRETLTAKLVHRLHDANFLSVIIGASGSGKSSLVRAGVVPVIKKGSVLIDGTKPPEGSENWNVHVLTPTAHPLEALAIELTRDWESVTTASTLMDDLSKDPRSLHFFLSRQAQTGDSSTPDHTLLVIDQFEELFTLCRDDFEREAFIDNLLTALNITPLPLGEEQKGESLITLIITLRADFYSHLAQYPELRDGVAHQQEYIGPMTPEELRLAIEEPARRGHWEFEPGLVDLILRDVGDEPGTLPLLSHALLETWKRRAGRTLTLKGYADAGGVHGAIAHTAEGVFEGLSNSNQKIMRDILLRLTEFGEGTEDTRRRASFNELMSQSEDGEAVHNVLNKLAEARLVTLSEDTAEVAHEALIREWSQLRDWLNQDREGIILHRRLTEAAQEWELLERDIGSLYRGARLAQANEWSALNPNALNAQEKSFLNASNQQVRRDEREREEQRERELTAAKELAETQRLSASRLQIRNRVITAVGGVAIILAVLAGMFGLQSNQNAISAENNAATAVNAQSTAQSEALARATQQAIAEVQRERAEEQAAASFSRELAAAALNNLDQDPELSILLALQGLDAFRTREAQDALHQAILESRIRTRLDSPGRASFVTYNHDGSRLLTSDEAGAMIWDTATWKPLHTLPIDIFVSRTDFSPDGSLAITSNDDGTVSIWEVETGREVFTFQAHQEGWVQHAVLNPNSTVLATTSNDGTAKLWDWAASLASGKGVLLHILQGHSNELYYASFSPDGSRVATSADDGTMRVWDVETGLEVFKLNVGGADITFSPDGRYLVSGSKFGRLFVWDAEDGRQLSSTYAHGGDNIQGVVFSPDGGLLASASNDGTVRIWHFDPGGLEELMVLAGHDWHTVIPDFSPDGRFVATGSRDGTVRLWDITPTGNQELGVFPGHQGRNSHVIFSQDDSLLFTSGFGGRVRAIDTKSGAELFSVEAHSDMILGLALSLDGRFVATAGEDGIVKVLDSETGAEILAVAAHEVQETGFFRGAMAVDFSPDGRRLVSSGNDNLAKVWDAATGEELFVLAGHEGDVNGVAYSPDGKIIATASGDKTTRIWDTADGTHLYTLITEQGGKWGIHFSPDGTRLVTGDSAEKVEAWVLPDNHWNAPEVISEPLFAVASNAGWLSYLKYSPDGKQIAVPGTTGFVELRDAETGELLQSFVHPSGVMSVNFSSDGKHLATAGFDGITRLFTLDIDELIELGKSRLTRSLFEEECQLYLHLDTCPNKP